MALEVRADDLDTLIEIGDLIELAQSDHPEDYNLEECHRKVIKLLEEYE